MDAKLPTYTVADLIADFLESESVSSCFQLSGGMIAFLAEAIDKRTEIALHNVKHEQAAGFAAEGVARHTGRPSVAFATSGPGATNLITPIASCFFDSSPVVFITGQVHSLEIRKDDRQRQNGFQELRIAQLVAPIVKLALEIKSPDEVLPALREAWITSTHGRPGPVLIDIPIDIQQMETSRAQLTVAASPKVASTVADSVRLLKDLVEGSSAPLIVAGGGIKLAGSSDSFRKFVDKAGIPVVWSLMAKDCLPTEHPLNFGMIGSYGIRCANRALANSDLLIVFGSRLDVRQTGSSIEDFIGNRQIFRVDIDKAELRGRISSGHPIEANLKNLLPELADSDISFDPSPQKFSFDLCMTQNPISQEQNVSTELSPQKIMEMIASLEVSAGTFVVDVGQHQMWAAQSLPLRDGQEFMTSGGLGAMGFAIPVALGVSTVSNSRVVAIVGDGCAQISLPELETLRYLNSNLSIYVINNQQHGMVAQFQEENLSSNYVGTRAGYSAPNFAEVAAAFGLRSYRIDGADSLAQFLKAFRQETSGPIVVEIMVDQSYKALPKLGGSTSLNKM